MMTGTMRTRVEFDLEDGNDPGRHAPRTVQVCPDATRSGISISLEGHGLAEMEPGHGPPIHLELYAGKFKLYVWADINDPNPTHEIDLSGAAEDCRKPELEVDTHHDFTYYREAKQFQAKYQPYSTKLTILPHTDPQVYRVSGVTVTDNQTEE
jgi:hypothetical protein